MSDTAKRTGEGGGTSSVADLPDVPQGTGPPQADRVVFGVTALLTLAFIAWGAASTASLKNASTPPMTKGPARGCSAADRPLAGPGRVTS